MASSILASGPRYPGFDSQHSRTEEKFANDAEVNQWHCLEESEQWLETVDQTQIVQASGKLVLQKDAVGTVASMT